MVLQGKSCRFEQITFFFLSSLNEFIKEEEPHLLLDFLIASPFFLCNILAMIGLAHNKPNYLGPWLLLSMIGIIIGFFGGILSLDPLFTDGDPEFFFVCGFSLVFLICWLYVKNTFIIMRRDIIKDNAV